MGKYLNLIILQLVGNIILKSLEIKLVLAQTIANNANPWIALFDPMAKNMGESKPAADILAFAERNEEYSLIIIKNS